MRDMPFLLEAVPLSLQFTSVEAVCNVAGVGAIFPGAVFADAKCLPTMAADDLAFTAMVDQFRVGIPPFGSAGIGAKYPGFPSRILNQRRVAALAYAIRAVWLLNDYCSQGVTPTVGFYGIYGQTHHLGNLFVA